MREFVVLGHTAPVEPDFDLDDLAGGAGRLDVLCRCVNSAVFLSHAVRTDVRVFLVLRDTVTVRIDGGSVRQLNPDERNIAALLRNAIEGKAEAVGAQPYETSPGIAVLRRGLEPVLEDHVAGETLLHLHEDGTPVADLEPPSDPVFVLSDHRDFTEAEADLLAERADARLRLGPKALHADHAITVAHNYLDTDGYTAY